MEAGTVCGAWGDTVAGYTTGGMGLGTDPYALYMPWLQRRGRPLNTIQETRGEVDCPTPHHYLSTCNGQVVLGDAAPDDLPDPQWADTRLLVKTTK